MELLQITHDAKTWSCSLQTESNSPLPRKTFTELIQCEEVELVSSPLCSSLFGVGRFPVDYQKRNMNTNSVRKLLTYNVSHMQDVLGQ